MAVPDIFLEMSLGNIFVKPQICSGGGNMENLQRRKPRRRWQGAAKLEEPISTFSRCSPHETERRHSYPGYREVSLPIQACKAPDDPYRIKTLLVQRLRKKLPTKR